MFLGRAASANLNTATFDNDGMLWFTGQNGVYGRLDPSTRQMEVFDAPRGRGPYGIATSPNGNVYYASLAGSYIGRIDLESGEATVLDPPTPNQGARRVWSDSLGRIWVSEWNAGQVAVYDPSADEWREWKLPGSRPRTYAVYVDERDMVWLSDFGANAVLRFDPQSEEFEVFDLPSNPSNVRQILGRRGEVWLPESAADQLVVIDSTSTSPAVTQDVVTPEVAKSEQVDDEGSFLRVIAPLDEARGYCLDIPGHRTSVQIESPLHVHTCKHGIWNQDGRFDVAALGNGVLRMPHYDLCLQAANTSIGARLLLAECTQVNLQIWILEDSGEIALEAFPQMCITVQEGPGRGAGGPRYLIKGVGLDTCAQHASDRQRWTTVIPR